MLIWRYNQGTLCFWCWRRIFILSSNQICQNEHDEGCEIVVEGDLEDSEHLIDATDYFRLEVTVLKLNISWKNSDFKRIIQTLFKFTWRQSWKVIVINLCNYTKSYKIHYYFFGVFKVAYGEDVYRFSKYCSEKLHYCNKHWSPSPWKICRLWILARSQRIVVCYKFHHLNRLLNFTN